MVVDSKDMCDYRDLMNYNLPMLIKLAMKTQAP